MAIVWPIPSGNGFPQLYQWANQMARLLSSSSLLSGVLPDPGPSSLGGIKSHAAIAHQFLTSINTDGSSSSAQPAASDVSGLAASATTDTTNASNITSGTLDGARLPNPAASTLGGVKSLAAVSHQFLTSIGLDGTPAQAQPSASDVSGLAASATTDTTNASNISSGTLGAARLPNPSVGALGGVKSLAAVSHQFLTSIGLDGTPAQAQPAASDISGLAASATTDTTNASNITSGTLPAAQLPVPSATTLGGVKSLTAVSHQFLTSISIAGVPAQAQPDFTDLSGTATTAQGGTGQTTGAREKLSAARTYYVRTDGSNSNTGLVNSAGGAFLTIQKAYNTILTLDLNGNNVTIQVGDGTYSGGLSCSSPAIGGNVTLQGNTGAMSNVIISTSGDCINNSAPGFQLTISYFKLTSSGGNCISGIAGSYQSYDHIEFGSCTSGTHVRMERNALAICGGPVTISGGAQAHLIGSIAGVIYVNTQTFTLTGTPAFSSWFAEADSTGVVIPYNITFVGGATGVRYSAASNGVVNTFGAGATYLPGNAAGSTGTGGQYI